MRFAVCGNQKIRFIRVFAIANPFYQRKKIIVSALGHTT